MAVKINSAKANLKRETEGDWVPVPELPGVEFKVRGLNYGPYINALSMINERNVRRWLSKGKNVPHDIVYQNNARLYLDHILLDWKGLVGDDGEPIPVEHADDILQDPAYRDFHDYIRAAAMSLAEVEIEFVEESAKNSSRSSDGSSQTAAQ